MLDDAGAVTATDNGRADGWGAALSGNTVESLEEADLDGPSFEATKAFLSKKDLNSYFATKGSLFSTENNN